METFGEFYNEFVNRIYGYLKIRITDDFLINDIIQEVFIAVWKNAKQYNGDSAVSAWVFGIVRNKLQDNYREKYKKTEDIELSEDIHYQEADFTEQLTDGMLLKKAVESLPSNLRELVYLVFTQGFTYKEAAVLLDIPEGTVKSRIYSIRALIRKKLEEG